MKLPVLYSHYMEHRAQNQNLSFSDFLANHYEQEGKNHTESHQHLPFKCPDIQVISGIFLHTEPQHFVVADAHTPAIANEYPTVAMVPEDPTLKGIFQPPRV